tara:strand:+ start:604 stop:864 length:261 start_codon:yes stop_codon:yes gene_type:complete
VSFLLRDLMAQMGYPDNDKHMNWELGAALREGYRQAYGRLPPKQLATKASGAGSHCFAQYPDSFRGRAAELIELGMAAKSQQLSLI